LALQKRRLKAQSIYVYVAWDQLRKSLNMNMKYLAQANNQICSVIIWYLIMVYKWASIKRVLTESIVVREKSEAKQSKAISKV